MKEEKILTVTEAVTLATKTAAAAGIPKKDVFRLSILMHRAAKDYVAQYGRNREI